MRRTTYRFTARSLSWLDDASAQTWKYCTGYYQYETESDLCTTHT